MKKIALYGLSGSGKSTTAHLIKTLCESKGEKCEVIKLAQPLYELQQHFYKLAGRSIAFYEQDQLLLEAIAHHLRRISPTCLADNFLNRLSSTTADVVINDDLRDPFVDYLMLKKEGFIFIKIYCSEEIRLERLKNREDVTVVLQSNTTSNLDLIKPDYLLYNNTMNIEDLNQKIQSILEGIN